MSNLKPLSVLFLLAAAAMASSALAAPRTLQGDDFITVMQGNTLSGTTKLGTAFDMYFLPGGTATYRDATGTYDSGSWHLDRNGDVCVAWQTLRDIRQGCFRVVVDRNKIAWEAKAGSGRATLRGDVTDTFLKRAGQ
jgi:hypothetical protein